MSRITSGSITIYDVIDGAAPVYERAYSTIAGLFSEMGDPTTPGAGVTWTTVIGPAPATAYWIAERITLGVVVGDWQLFPVKAKDGGLPFVTYTKAGFNKPTLGDSTWIADAVAAVSAFTGRPYTNQKEFGYGTTVVITYDNGKLSGIYRRSANTDVWVAPTSFIDGDLIVDDSISANHLSANSVNTNAITLDGNLEFVGDSAATSGVTFDKSGLDDDATGLFLGRDKSVAGIAISGPGSLFKVTSDGTFEARGLTLYKGEAAVANQYSSGISILNIDLDNISTIDVAAIGGGGGATQAASSNSRNAGGAGGTTLLQFYDDNNGSGTLLGTLTMGGGAAGANTVDSDTYCRYGRAGQSSTFGAGGTRGRPGLSSNSTSGGTNGGDGYRGSGGGTGGACGNNPQAVPSSGGYAGTSYSDILTPGVGVLHSNTKSIRITIGAGGAGGAGNSQTYSGGNGGQGYASITLNTLSGASVDFSSLGLSAVSGYSSTTLGASSGAFDPDGPGWYMILPNSPSTVFWGGDYSNPGPGLQGPTVVYWDRANDHTTLRSATSSGCTFQWAKIQSM